MDRKLIDWGSVIKVGNKVRIREFDDMEKQYGYRYVGDVKVINVFMSFTEDMKKICGDVINIDEEIEKNYEKRGYFYYQGFSISTDMLEPYEEELDVINIPVKDEYSHLIKPLDEYLKDLHEEKQEKEISYLEKEWGIKDNILYGIIYESEQTGERKFFGEIINFNPYQVFIIDDKMGLTILSIKNIISMIPIKDY